MPTIRVELMEGRTPEQKKSLVKALTQAVVETLGAYLQGDKAWPLSFWSRARLFSVAARRGWVEPDLKPLSAPA